MKSDVPSPVGLEELNPSRRHPFLVDKDIFGMPALAKRIHWRMLHKKQVIRCIPGPTCRLYPDILLQQGFLVIPSLLIVHSPQIFEDNCSHILQIGGKGTI